MADQPVVVQKEGTSGAVVAILVLVVVALAAWFGYKQGYFTGKDAQPSDQPDININLPGTSSAPKASPGY